MTHSQELIYTASLSHHEMLEEPGAHDVGGVFRQDPPFVFGLLVFAVQQGRQVHVYLGRKDKGGKKRSRWYSLVIATETKGDNSYPGTPPQV